MTPLLLALVMSPAIALLVKVAIVCVILWAIWALLAWAGVTIPRPVQIILIAIGCIVGIYLTIDILGLLL
jgi:hypothetical protein